MVGSGLLVKSEDVVVVKSEDGKSWTLSEDILTTLIAGHSLYRKLLGPFSFSEMAAGKDYIVFEVVDISFGNSSTVKTKPKSKKWGIAAILGALLIAIGEMSPEARAKVIQIVAETVANAHAKERADRLDYLRTNGNRGVQQYLSRLGRYPADRIDGIVGSLTRAGVEGVEREHQLPVTGDPYNRGFQEALVDDVMQTK
jgi:hypothetical protein